MNGKWFLAPKTLLALIALAFSLSGCGTSDYSITRVEPDGETLLWPYYIGIPKRPGRLAMIVETNNPGQPDDDFSVHDRDARATLERNIRRFRDLGVVVLSPAFPRPASQVLILTQALDRDTVFPARQPVVALTVRYHGPELTGDNNYSYDLRDILVIQDDLPYRCLGSDFPPFQFIGEGTDILLTFYMQPGWDPGRNFTFIEALEGGLFFASCLLAADGEFRNSEERNALVEGRSVFTLVGIEALDDLPNSAYSAGGQDPREEHALFHLDLQLASMIDDARTRFDLTAYPSKVVMVGFSASGQFANRFALLHPDLVLAVAAGACGGYMVPVSEYEGRPLPYPLGTADYREITGRDFDAAAFRSIPHFFYMGESDTNDPLSFEDGYSDEDRDLAFPIMGGPGELMARFAVVENLFRLAGARATFVTYPGVGHRTTTESDRAVFEFVEGVFRAP